MRATGGVAFLDFPSFSEGLSLRSGRYAMPDSDMSEFPFLFGGTFIEECPNKRRVDNGRLHFPSFSEGLSLRITAVARR